MVTGLHKKMRLLTGTQIGTFAAWERVSGDCRDRQCHHPGRKKAESVLSSGDHKLSACAGV